jgi:hypothetical protein
MKKTTRFLLSFSRAAILLSFFVLTQCADDEILLTPETTTTDPTISATTITDCGCTYTVPVSTNTVVVDGNTLGIKAGAVICLKGGATYKNIIFKNLRGTSLAPITIKNCNGIATINATGTYYGIKTQLSSFIHITGGTGSTYGIKVISGHHSITLEYLTTNVEVDHVEVSGSGFSGIMAKTDPSCDDKTIRGNFTMKDVFLHHNYVHDTGGEAFYVGHTFWVKGVSTSCGTRYPHALENVKIYNNVIKNSGWESIQIGSTPTGALVYNNRIENYGIKNTQYQNHGVQFGEGAPGKFYGNYINGGKGNALQVIGNPENFIHDNVIINAGMEGMFIEDRSIGAGFKIMNNTIINPKLNGIKLYSDQVASNLVYNNIIVNPGSYSTYVYPRTGNDAYVYLLTKTMPVTMQNNYFTRDVNAVKFVSPSTFNFALTSTSPVINKGTSISAFGITVDHALKPRLAGTLYDIGAYEFQ